MSRLVLEQWLILDGRSEVFRMAVTNKRVLRDYSRGFRAPGFELIRTALAESLVVGTVRLLKAREKQEASLQNLVEGLRSQADSA